MKINIKYRSKFGRHRLRVRRVDEEAVAYAAVEKARKMQAITYSYDHGGDVDNSYGYTAFTECAVAIADPNGNVVLFCERAVANKNKGEKAILRACLDRHIKTLTIDYQHLVELFERSWSPLEQLASCAED